MSSAARVGLLNDISTLGGGQTVMLQLAEALRDGGLEPQIICPDGPLREAAAAAGIPSHGFRFNERRLLTPRLRLPRGQAIIERQREAKRLDRLLREERIDVLHTGSTVAHVTGLWCARLAPRRPLVWHVNQVHARELFAGPLPDLIVAVSAAALGPACWRRSARRRAIVVPNGVDVTRFRPPTPEEREQARRQFGATEERPLAITVCRLEPSKGVDVVINAITRSTERPQLFVVGDATGYSGGETHANDLRQQARASGAPVEFLGPRSDVPQLMWASDVVVHASRWEAFGLVLIEAAASALPVIATQVGGCPEVVRDGETGLLVPPNDAAALARALDSLLADRSGRSAMGASGRALAVDRYSLEAFAARIVPWYRFIAGTGPRPIDRLEP